MRESQNFSPIGVLVVLLPTIGIIGSFPLVLEILEVD